MRRWACYSGAMVAWVCCLFLHAPYVAVADAPRGESLSAPIAGENGVDYVVVNHVDHDSQAGPLGDYLCLERTYDGHQGTDFVLRGFAQMDEGVDVRAALDGAVAFVQDGFYDRNKQVNGDGFGNYVALDHGGGLYTYYAHLKNASLTVEVGQPVARGQKLGEVASSGNSTDPHLHFEMWRGGVNLDPYRGACDGVGDVKFAEPEPYDTELFAFDCGTSNVAATLDDLRERVGATSRLLLGRDTVVTAWVLAVNMPAHRPVRVRWIAPDGRIWSHFQTSFEAPLRYAYWWSWLELDASMPVGDWRAVISVGDEALTTIAFEISQARRPAQAEPP